MKVVACLSLAGVCFAGFVAGYNLIRSHLADFAILVDDPSDRVTTQHFCLFFGIVGGKVGQSMALVVRVCFTSLSENIVFIN